MYEEDTMILFLICVKNYMVRGRKKENNKLTLLKYLISVKYLNYLEKDIEI